MVRTAKMVLKKVIGRSNLNYDELFTILTEVESIVNDRPITYAYDDVEAISWALSPSQLVYGRRLANTPNSGHFESVSTCSSLTRRAKNHRRNIEHFVNRWRRVLVEFMWKDQSKREPKEYRNNRSWRYCSSDERKNKATILEIG